MKIAIVGWYGTETIGDRAILAGLLSLFTQTFGTYEIKLGSLFPFFSERTINEDRELWDVLCQRDINIEIFNSRRYVELDRSISESDLVVMGGGPLMDINDLYMIEYAFKKAQKLSKKTALLGCGVGPLFNKSFRKSVLEITKHSNLIILRDSNSKEYLRNIFDEFNIPWIPDVIYTSFDPAVECVMKFNKYYTRNNQDYIAMNLRKYPKEYSMNKRDVSVELYKFVQSLAQQYNNCEIRLIPMHYFHIGDDDREFLNEIKQTVNSRNILVQNKILTLKQTIEVFRNAYFNIGMRFHSIVLQTVASGKNYILDYTEPNKGKIKGFIDDIDENKFYINRYISLQTDIINTDFIQDVNSMFTVNESLINDKMDIYCHKMIGLNTN